jgi:hypothetical protein
MREMLQLKLALASSATKPLALPSCSAGIAIIAFQFSRAILAADRIGSFGGIVMNNESHHRLTPVAIFAVFVLTIPGLVLGQIAAFLYGWFLSGMFDGNLINWISGGWFKIVVMAIIPNALSGVIGGLVGVRLAYVIKPLREANYEIVAYAISTIVVALSAIGIFIVFHRDGISIGIVENIANGAGIVVGLFVGQQSIKEDQRSPPRAVPTTAK